MTEGYTKADLLEEMEKAVEGLKIYSDEIGRIRRLSNLYFKDTWIPGRVEVLHKEAMNVYKHADLMLDLEWAKMPEGERRIRRPKATHGDSRRFKVYVGPGNADCREFYADDVETFRRELRGYAEELADLAWGELTGVQSKEFFRTDKIMIRTLTDIRQAEIPEKKEMRFRTIYDDGGEVNCVHCGFPADVGRCPEVTYSKVKIEDRPVVIEKRVLECVTCKTKFIAARFFREDNSLEAAYKTLVY